MAPSWQMLLASMNTRIASFWETIHSSLWFIPGLMTGSAILIAVGLIAVDQRIELSTSPYLSWLYSGEAEGARQLLATIAGSMITVAGVTFSITIVALSLASSQYGPRLLQNFMRDSGNQIVLGTFIATFIYCLIVLRSTREGGESEYIPGLAVSAAVLFAVFSLAVLIYFIHHVSRSIQASVIVANVHRELDEGIDRLYPEHLGEEPEDADGRQEQEPPPGGGVKINAERTGFVRAVDNESLMTICREHDLLVRLLARPGSFVSRDIELLELWPGAPGRDVENQLRNSFVIGQERSLTQDTEFAIGQLVEVALRALSPSLNDPFTAGSCTRYLGAALLRLSQRRFPARQRFDEEGRMRIVTDYPDFESLTRSALQPLIEHGRGNRMVLETLMDTLEMLVTHVRNPQHQRILLEHAGRVRDAAVESLPEEYDRRSMERRFRSLVTAAPGSIAG